MSRNWRDKEIGREIINMLEDHGGESGGIPHPKSDEDEEIPEGMHLVGEEVTEDTDAYQQKQVERMYL